MPRNPVQRTGMTGRGSLGRWGPNHIADAIITRFARDETSEVIFRCGRPVLEFLAYRNKHGDVCQKSRLCIRFYFSGRFTSQGVLYCSVLPCRKYFTIGRFTVQRVLHYSQFIKNLCFAVNSTWYIVLHYREYYRMCFYLIHIAARKINGK